MAKATKKTVTENREDLSRFVVHLTRDHEPGDRAAPPGSTEIVTARGNLEAMLEARRIEARAPHCIANPLLKEADVERQRDFHVVCLTEVPLDQVHLLVQEIEGRGVHLMPYGLVFERHFIIQRGGQPAIYINTYGADAYLKGVTGELYESWLNDEPVPKAPRLLPFMNAMHEKYDFAWEREWRVLGNLEFNLSDLVAVILPPEGDEDIRGRLAELGIAVISPGWTYERIIAELSSQLRTTHGLLRAEVLSLQRELRELQEE